MTKDAYGSVSKQQGMALDPIRNQWYLTQLQRLITPNSVVLDLGAGLGTLGLFAAKLGAKKVYMVEPQNIIKLIPKLADDNAVADKVVCLQGTIETVHIPEKVDIIISVFTGNFLLEENLLPSLFYARDKYLKKNGKLLPDSAQMWAVPVTIPKYHEQHIKKFDQPHNDLNVSALKKYLSNEIVIAHFIKPHHYISEPQLVKTVDFIESHSARCHQTNTFEALRTTTCQGFVGWFKIFSSENALSLSPSDAKTHWTPLLFLSEKTIKVKFKDNISININKTENTIWSWRFDCQETTESMSEMHTWLSRPPLL